MSVMQGAPKNKLIFPLCCLHTNVGLATCVSIHNKNHLLSATSQSGQGSFWPSHYTLTPNNPQLMKEWKQLLHTIIYWRLLTVRANMISLKFLFPTILFLIALTESLGLGIQRHICITWSVRLFVHLDIWTSQNLFFFSQKIRDTEALMKVVQDFIYGSWELLQRLYILLLQTAFEVCKDILHRFTNHSLHIQLR